MTEDVADQKIADDSKEFFAVRILDEAEVYFSTLPAVYHNRLVKKLTRTALEGREADAQLVADLLTRVVTKEHCSVEALKAGFIPLVDGLKDIEIDSPQAPNNMALMMGAMSSLGLERRSNPQNAPITRSEIWYEDGSVILQAQEMYFRVHWGVLAQQSSFFRDMQGLPQPPDQPSLDGCPIVELHDDAADVESLLKALYSPTFLTQTALPLSAVAALVRLGTKYDFRVVWESAVGRLVFENPISLEGYHALMVPGKGYNTTRIVHYPGILLDILTLARENNILSALPCAYYRVIMHYTPTQLFDGVPRGDGTLARLAPVDQRRCMISRDELIKARFQEGYSLGWLKKWEYDSDCADPAKCAQGRNARVHYYIMCAPLWILHRSAEDQKVLCPACNRHSTESTLAGRKKLWEDLPKFFDLPPWSELKNEL